MTRMKTRTSAIAAAMILPLSLASLTACGKDDKAEEGDLKDAPQSSEQVSSAKPASESESKKPSESKKDDKPSEEKKEDKPGEPEGSDKVENPLAGANIPTNEAKPVDGQAGSEEDRKAMEAALTAILNPPNLGAWTRVILDNSCKPVRDMTHQQLAAQGMTLEQMEEQFRQAEAAARAAGQPLPETPSGQVSLKDVRVNGNQGSATATITSKGKSETGVQRFERENGKWKVCNAS